MPPTGEGAMCGGAKPLQPQPLAALRRDPIAGPGRVEAQPHRDLLGQPERADALGDLLLHDADGRAAHERRQQLDLDVAVVDAKRSR